jgi:hypothetical protein
MSSMARRWFLRLSAPLPWLLASASLMGVAWPPLYRDPPVIAAQAVGQDWVTLLVAAPVLALARRATARGSALGEVVALGVLGYAAYAYALYAFGTRHNELFLVYVAILSLSVWGLVAGLVEIDAPRLATRAAPRLAWRWIGSYFVVLAALFASLWLAEIVPALLRRQTPATVVAWGTPTNGVHVLDLAFVLPVLLWTGVRLWHHKRDSVVVAGVLLFKIVTLGLAILAMGVFQIRRGQHVDAGLMTIFAVMSVVSIAAAVHFTRAVGWRTQPAGAPRSRRGDGLTAWVTDR